MPAPAWRLRARPCAAVSAALLDAYRRPVPLLDVGRALAPHVTAMMDVSDGLLIDASRLAEASGVFGRRSISIRLCLAVGPTTLVDHIGDDREPPG